MTYVGFQGQSSGSVEVLGNICKPGIISTSQEDVAFPVSLLYSIIKLDTCFDKKIKEVFGRGAYYMYYINWLMKGGHDYSPRVDRKCTFPINHE